MVGRMKKRKKRTEVTVRKGFYYKYNENINVWKVVTYLIKKILKYVINIRALCSFELESLVTLKFELWKHVEKIILGNVFTINFSVLDINAAKLNLPLLYLFSCFEEFDECSSSPCLNGGTCTDGNSNYACSCPSPFFGHQCQGMHSIRIHNFP